MGFGLALSTRALPWRQGPDRSILERADPRASSRAWSEQGDGDADDGVEALRRCKGVGHRGVVLTLAAPGGAQSLTQTLPQTAAAPTGFFCIDPMATGARRTWRAEPCKLPLVAWPLLVDVIPDEPKRGGKFEREASAEQGAPDLFWRSPWHDYSSHSTCSAYFWR